MLTELRNTLENTYQIAFIMESGGFLNTDQKLLKNKWKIAQMAVKNLQLWKLTQAFNFP